MTLLYQLVCHEGSYLLQTLNSFVQMYVFGEVDTEKQDKQLTNRQNYLYRFCKLVIFNVCPSVPADAFRHYLNYNRDYGDIIKVILEKKSWILTLLLTPTYCSSSSKASVIFTEMPQIA
jgi:hypothetical protein